MPAVTIVLASSSFLSIPGKEIRYHIPAEGSQPARETWARYYAIGQQLYQVNLNVPAGKPWPPGAALFLDSFRLTSSAVAAP